MSDRGLFSEQNKSKNMKRMRMRLFIILLTQGFRLMRLKRLQMKLSSMSGYCVSGISTALSMPGGIVMAATIPADIVQYYGYWLRAAQNFQTVL